MQENIFSLGCIPSPPDNRDYKARDYVSMGIRPLEYIPEKKAPVLYQKDINSCVAHAIATMKWYHERQEKKVKNNIARITFITIVSQVIIKVRV